MTRNTRLTAAKSAKKDEFYTRLADVEREIDKYRPQLKNKTVYLPCDDVGSAFWQYFHLQFNLIGLKKLIATHYNQDGSASYAAVYTGGNGSPVTDDTQLDWYDKIPLKEDGDFRNDECIKLLDESDVVITNPPFSLFREFVHLLVEHKKKFLVWGNLNAITYKEIFPLIKDDKLWLSYLANKTCYFRLSDDYDKWDEKFTRQQDDGHKYGKVPSITVYTNLENDIRQYGVDVWKEFSQEDSPIFDNYPAFNISKVIEIPKDKDIVAAIPNIRIKDWKRAYKDDLSVIKSDSKTSIVQIHRPAFGVPITFLTEYNPEQFEILGLTTGRKDFESPISWPLFKYTHCIQHNHRDGSTTNGSKMNTRGMVAVNTPEKNWYTADNSPYKLLSIYARILIRPKEAKNESN